MSWQQRRIYKCEAGILAVILPFSIICLLAFSGPLLSACSDDDEGKYLELEALGQCIPPPSHVYTCVAIRIRIRKRICIRIRDPDRHQNLIICSLAHCQSSLKISCKSVRKFLRNVDNRQTDRQTDRQRRLHNLLGGGNNGATIAFQNVGSKFVRPRSAEQCQQSYISVGLLV